MFTLMFSNVSMILVYMIAGYMLCKSKKAKVTSAKSMSALLLYVLSPCMIINSFLQLEFSKESFVKISKYFLVTLVIQLLFFGVLFLVFGRKYNDARYRILSVGAALGNVGFLGMPIIAAIFPDEPIVLCYSSINVLTMNLIVFTVGIFLITNNKKFISTKSAIMNPTTISILIALPLYFFGVKFPSNVMNSIGILAKAVTPMCMIILGMRLSEANLKDIFTRPFVYITCALKLIAFPLFAFLCVHFLPFLDDILKTTVVVLACTPSGAVIESLAELHECEQEFAANVVLMTTILCVLTIPVMTNILI